MTTAQNNMLYDLGNKPPIFYPIDVTGSNDINQGDNCWFDSSAHQIKSLDSDNHAATYVGVAARTSYINPYGTKVYPSGSQLPVWVAGVFTFNTSASETYSEQDTVYYNTDAQTIQKTSGSHAIGYAKMLKGVSSVAGASGVILAVQIIPVTPSSGVA